MGADDAVEAPAICGSCGSPNDANRRFCQQCGESLVSVVAHVAAADVTVQASTGLSAGPSPQPSSAAPLTGLRAPPDATTAPTPGRFLTDEPTSTDQLGRGAYVEAIARMLVDTQTPLTVGVYGRWGTGKTSFLRQLEDRLRDQVAIVWFDAWRHQNTADPVISLVQRITTELDLDEAAARRIGRALLEMGGEFLPALGSVVPVVGKLPRPRELRARRRYLEEVTFRLQSEQDSLLAHFDELMTAATEKSSSGRLVVFIDDLDRCRPDVTVRLLEALKIYLSHSGGVFVIALDRAAAESALALTYDIDGHATVEYLDKIVQVPFHLPPIQATRRSLFAHELAKEVGIGVEQRDTVRSLLEHGMADNPRSAKRLANSYALAASICATTLRSFDPRVLAIVIVAQYSCPELFDHLRTNRTSLGDLTNEDAEACKLLRASDHQLGELLVELQLDAGIVLNDYVEFAPASRNTPLPIAELGELPQQRVTDGATVRCSLGTAHQQLRIEARVIGDTIDETATVDSVGPSSIGSFGMCMGQTPSAVPMTPCQPVLTRWMNTSRDDRRERQTVTGAHILTVNAVCPCARGGIVTVLDRGTGSSQFDAATGGA